MSTSVQALVALLVLWALVRRASRPHLRLLTLVVVCVVALRVARPGVSAAAVRAHLLTTDDVNETFVVEGRVGGQPALFMVDTAYAGAPAES